MKKPKPIKMGRMTAKFVEDTVMLGDNGSVHSLFGLTTYEIKKLHAYLTRAIDYMHAIESEAILAAPKKFGMIDRIKAYRNKHGCSLMDAKSAVEANKDLKRKKTTAKQAGGEK